MGVYSYESWGFHDYLEVSHNRIPSDDGEILRSSTPHTTDGVTNPKLNINPNP